MTTISNTSTVEDYFIQSHKYKTEYGEKNTVVLMQVGSFYEVYALKLKKQHKQSLLDLNILNDNDTESLKNDTYFFGNTNIIKLSKSIDMIVSNKKLSMDIYITQDNQVYCFDPNKVVMDTSTQSNNFIDYIDNPSQNNITIKHTFSCELYMCGFPSTKDYIIEKYVQKLLSNGFTIPIFNQYDIPNDTRKERKLHQIITAGTYFSEDITSLTNHICVLRFYYNKNTLFKIKQGKNTNSVDNGTIIVGMTSVDVLTGSIVYYEYGTKYTNTPSDFDELFCFLSSFNPSEVLCLYDSNQIIDFNKQTNISNKHIDLWMSYMDCNNYRIIDCRDTTEKSNTGYINMKSSNTKICNNINLNISKQARNAEKPKYQHEIIKYFYGEVDVYSFYDTYNFNENMCALHAFIFVLDYISKHNKKIVQNIQQPQMFKNNNNVYIGNHSFKQLNYLSADSTDNNIIFNRDIGENDYKQDLSSVVKFLCKCKTNMGRREIHNRLVCPTTDITYLNEQYNMIEFFSDNMEECNNIYNLFTKLCDIDKYITMMGIGSNKFDISKMYNLIKTTNIFDEIYKLFSPLVNDDSTPKTINTTFNCFDSTLFFELKEWLSTLFYTQDEINNKLLYYTDENDSIFTQLWNTNIKNNVFRYTGKEDKTSCLTDLYNNYESFKHSLLCIDTIRKYICNLLVKNEKKKTITAKYENNFCKFYKTDKDSISLRLTKTRKDKLVKIIKNKKLTDVELTYTYNDKVYTFVFNIGKVQFNNTTSTTCSIDEEQLNLYIVDLMTTESLLQQLRNEYYNENLSTLNNKYTKLLRDIAVYIIEFDIGMTKAIIANKYNYCKPTIVNETKSSSSKIVAKQMRHILIERFLVDEIYVPNDITIDSDNSIILFGTNAVGKSSLIKSIGICVILAQCGFYVPCESFVYKPFSSIFTRILGNDNIFKGLSTFAVEMTEFRSILKQSDKNSLILGDELCSGTEMASAMSIFLAGLYYLTNQKSCFIFATHFHEILQTETFKNIENTIKIKHMAVVYDKDKQELIYNRKLSDGPGEQNYGIEVCKSLQLPDDFIKHALSIREELDNNLKQKFHNTKTICESDVSVYNNKKIKIKCEMCGNQNVDDVHHLQYQQDADEKGFIGHFDKNQVANLMNLCKECHNKIHKTKKRIVRRKKIKL